jgi:3',5'-cyclic AMP phosphodiesterase CpdA
MSLKLRRRLWVAVAALGLAAVVLAAGRLVPGGAGDRHAPGGAFVVAPYVQLGDAPVPAPVEALELLWQGHERDDAWSVEYQKAPGGAWAKAEVPTMHRLVVEGLAPRRLYRTTLGGLAPGGACAYRVRLGENIVFEAQAHARRAAGGASRFVAFGDGGANTSGQRAVALQVAHTQPDYVMITGDIAYLKGRMADYDEKFFPIYNSDDASPGSGAPLMRAVPFFAAPGNHDMVYRNLDDFPDALAYFLVWSQPLNGPLAAPGRGPDLEGSEARQQAFRERAGPAYPRMANFSFDYGDVHWTVLDANPYADFTAPAFRDWLVRDLAAAQGAAWRFVALHHPPFHSSKAHADDQRTRLLADLLEQGGVSVVFAGHVHNYQRSYPLRFAGATAAGPHVDGRWQLDRAYDGVTHTRPDGIIYLVTGAGGARLYDPDQTGDAASWRDYTARFVSNVHSLTVVDVEPRRLTVRQVSARGEELDRFTVTK